MTRTDLVDQSLFTMGLQRCAQYNKENVEKLARVMPCRGRIHDDEGVGSRWLVDAE